MGKYDAVFPGYPSASIFKIVSTVAAIEDFDMDVNKFQQNVLGCRLNKKNPPWRVRRHLRKNMNLSMAYGKSCNNFYAHMGISVLGVSNLIMWAKKLGWGAKNSI